MTHALAADLFVVKTRTFPFREWVFEGCYATKQLAEKVDDFYPKDTRKLGPSGPR
jgi:hypothetical protein